MGCRCGLWAEQPMTAVLADPGLRGQCRPQSSTSWLLGLCGARLVRCGAVARACWQGADEIVGDSAALRSCWLAAVVMHLIGECGILGSPNHAVRAAWSQQTGFASLLPSVTWLRCINTWYRRGKSKKPRNRALRGPNAPQNDCHKLA